MHWVVSTMGRVVLYCIVCCVGGVSGKFPFPPPFWFLRPPFPFRTLLSIGAIIWVTCSTGVTDDGCCAGWKMVGETDTQVSGTETHKAKGKNVFCCSCSLRNPIQKIMFNRGRIFHLLSCPHEPVSWCPSPETFFAAR